MGLLFTIDFFFVKDLLPDDLPSIRPGAVEAAPVPGVTGRPLLVHDKEDGIVVTVDADVEHLLHVAGLFALVPQLTPRT